MDCPICTEIIELGNEIMTPCDHIFHEDCLNEWTKNHTTCPTCRHGLISEGLVVEIICQKIKKYFFKVFCSSSFSLEEIVTLFRNLEDMQNHKLIYSFITSGYKDFLGDEDWQIFNVLLESMITISLVKGFHFDLEMIIKLVRMGIDFDLTLLVDSLSQEEMDNDLKFSLFISVIFKYSTNDSFIKFVECVLRKGDIVTDMLYRERNRFMKYTKRIKSCNHSVEFHDMCRRIKKQGPDGFVDFVNETKLLSEPDRRKLQTIISKRTGVCFCTLMKISL